LFFNYICLKWRKVRDICAARIRNTSESGADALIDKLMWYNSPEFPTAGEMLDAGFVGADYYFKNDKNKVTHLNFDFGKTAQNEEDSKKKATGLSNLISDFTNLSAGTYKWNGKSWAKQ